MIILFYSNSTGSAIKDTRRILDSFCERVGQDSWRSILTQAGLEAIRRNLVEYAKKNSSVTAHRVRGKDKIEFLWKIGNNKSFFFDGLVPVHYSKKKNLVKLKIEKEEKHMSYLANKKQQQLGQHLEAVGNLTEIIVRDLTGSDGLAELGYFAGIFHDIGKMDPEFQSFIDSSKKNIDESSGTHIEGGKFSFEKHPRHNEISLYLMSMIQIEGMSAHSKLEKIKHAVYFHHEEPLRKKPFIDLDDIDTGLITSLKKNNVSLNEFLYSVKNFINEFSKYKVSFDSELLNPNEPLPTYSKYQNSIEKIIDSGIELNSINSIIRSSLVSADRMISSVNNLSDIYNNTSELRNLYDDNRVMESKLSSDIVKMSEQFELMYPGSERSIKQAEVCDSLVTDESNVSVLFGPAGVGKTKIFLEFLSKTDVKKVFIICPRVVVAEGLYRELTEEYLPESSIEILTGDLKFKKIDNVESKLLESEFFESDIIITSIDQIVSIMNSHKNLNIFTTFMQSHVIFDEYHEYVNNIGFNLKFLELVRCKMIESDNIGRTLLVSATPNPTFLKFMLNNELEIHRIETFNDKMYQIEISDKYCENGIGSSASKEKQTIIVYNTAYEAQLDFIRNLDSESSLLIHSKYTKSDKCDVMNRMMKSFKNRGSKDIKTLRASPVVQASLNITCEHMIAELASAETLLQILGRLGRFGENETSLFEIMTDKDSQQRYLNIKYEKISANKFLESIKYSLNCDRFKLKDIYNVYFKMHEDNEEALFFDIQRAIEAGAARVNKLSSNPKAFFGKKLKEKKASETLRGNSRYINMAKLDIGLNVSDGFLFEKESDMTIEVEKITGYGDSSKSGLTFYRKSHSIFNSEYKKGYKDFMDLELAKSPITPIYMSYDDTMLKKMGVNIDEESSKIASFIYYVYKHETPVGWMELKHIAR